MKLFKNGFCGLTIVFAVVALVLFFLPFGEVKLAVGESIVGVGAEFAFGSISGTEISRSSQLIFCMILTAFTVLFSALSAKYNGTKWAAIGFSLVDAVYMLVMAITYPSLLDIRGPQIAGINENPAAYIKLMPLFIAIALFLTCASAIAHLLIADKIAVMESNGARLTIPQRVIKYLRDYKGEIKKIVWPGFRAVVKNTLIVLIMCLVCGVFIWAIDYGLGALLGLIYK